MLRHLLPFALALLTAAHAAAQPLGSVIFIHPDGTSAATWAAARAFHVGPDRDLNWDLLPAIALYRGHLRNSLSATSNSGATSHAFAVKADDDAFGLTAGGERGEPIDDDDGHSLSVAHQALRAGLAVGLVQTGIAAEPGTAVFLAPNRSRKNYDDITADLVHCGATVLFSGGEQHFRPEGAPGVHGPGARADDRDLIGEAAQLGYTIVFTRDELARIPKDATRVLGIFAHDATFNDRTEASLAERGLPLFAPDAPTVAEMTDAALSILSRSRSRFLLVVEEEATDNFGGKNNALGVLTALGRADDAIGVAQRYLLDHPDTLLLTAADSDAGGMRMIGLPVAPDGSFLATLPERDDNGSPLDGIGGTASAPFLAAPDRAGRRLPFAIAWASSDDVAGGVLVRAAGLNSHRVRGSMDNTDLPRLMRLTLFGSELGPRPVE
jgi:alkaline phosphatase